MASWAVVTRRRRYLNVRRWKKSNRERVRTLNKLSYGRTKVLKGKPPRLSREERNRRKNAANKLRRPQINARERERIRTDPQYCISRRLRACVRCAIKRFGINKAYDTMTLVGCSLQDFMKHLESLFLPGMTMENRSLWHVDHIRPLASFNLNDPEQQRIAMHYTNLQPLWAKDNQVKSNKYYAKGNAAAV